MVKRLVRREQYANRITVLRNYFHGYVDHGNERLPFFDERGERGVATKIPATGR